MDVTEYLLRIKYEGSLEPTLETLRELTIAHKTQISYSSLRMHGAPKNDTIELDLSKIYKHVITNKGAGLCYELNGIFAWLLQQLGYNVYYGRASFYLTSDKMFSDDFFHAIPIVTMDDGQYIVDAGWTMFGPMKIGHMSVYADSFNAYRMKLHPEFENTSNRFMIQRHRKTVLDKEGKILKQGPGTFFNVDEICKDEECKKEDSDHWVPLHSFCCDRQNLEDFQNCMDMHYDPDGLLMNNIFLIQYKVNSKHINHFMVKTTCTVKEALDPITDKIICEIEAKTNDDIKVIVEKYFNFKVQHPVTFLK